MFNEKSLGTGLHARLTERAGFLTAFLKRLLINLTLKKNKSIP